MSLQYILILVASLSTVVSSQHYNLGLCRTHLIKGVFNKTVTIQELVQDGEYTVLYTSGLKQFQDVSCARVGYTHESVEDTYRYYTYISTDKKEEVIAYDTTQVVPGKFNVSLGPDDDSVQYIIYHNHSVLLTYWCKKKGDDYYYNNIWIIAAKTPETNTMQTKQAVLEMLSHDDYKGLIDRDIEDTRDEEAKYVELSPCDRINF